MHNPTTTTPRPLRKDMLAELKDLTGKEDLGPTPDGHFLWTRKDIQCAIDAAKSRSKLLSRSIQASHKADALQARVRHTAVKRKVPAKVHPALKLEQDLEAAHAEYQAAESLGDRYAVYERVKDLIHNSTSIKRDAEQVRRAEAQKVADAEADKIRAEFAAMDAGPERSAFYQQHRDQLT